MKKFWIVTKMYYEEGSATAIEEIDNIGIFASLDLAEEGIANDAGGIDAPFYVSGSFTKARIYRTSINGDTVKYRVEAFEPKLS